MLKNVKFYALCFWSAFLLVLNHVKHLSRVYWQAVHLLWMNIQILCPSFIRWSFELNRAGLPLSVKRTKIQHILLSVCGFWLCHMEPNDLGSSSQSWKCVPSEPVFCLLVTWLCFFAECAPFSAGLQRLQPLQPCVLSQVQPKEERAVVPASTAGQYWFWLLT